VTETDEDRLTELKISQAQGGRRPADDDEGSPALVMGQSSAHSRDCLKNIVMIDFSYIEINDLKSPTYFIRAHENECFPTSESREKLRKGDINRRIRNKPRRLVYVTLFRSPSSDYFGQGMIISPDNAWLVIVMM
jgi:hypothetical protein